MCMHVVVSVSCFFFFFKQKTAYEMRISGWSSDVCSSDLRLGAQHEDQDDAGDEAADVRPPADVVGRRAAEGRDELEAEPEDQQQPGRQVEQIGRASCRDRVCQYV